MFVLLISIGGANLHTLSGNIYWNEKVRVITYEYDYDDFTFYIEADVQAIQTHNVNDAIGSLWGVNNVSAANGTVTVK